MPRYVLTKPVDLSDPAQIVPVLPIGGAVNDRDFLGYPAGEVLCAGLKTLQNVVPIPDTGEPPTAPVRPYDPHGTLCVYLQCGDWKKRFIPGPSIDFSEILKPYDGWTLKEDK